MVVVGGSNSQHKEILFRKRIANIFNKRQEDFDNFRDFNDYLEEVEDMIFKYVEGIDVPGIEEKIKLYQEENAALIRMNQVKKDQDREKVLAACKGLSTQAANDVVWGGSSDTGFAPQGQYAAATIRQPVPVIEGRLDTQEDEEITRLRAERGGRAGGWSIELSRKRAFEEAFASIWI